MSQSPESSKAEAISAPKVRFVTVQVRTRSEGGSKTRKKDAREYHWQTLLQRLSRRGEPKDFKEFLDEFPMVKPVDRAAVAAVYLAVIANDVAKTMLAAALQLPLHEAQQALHRIMGVIKEMQIGRDVQRVFTKQEQQWYHKVVRVIIKLLIPGCKSLMATFEAYITGNYDEALCEGEAPAEPAEA